MMPLLQFHNISKTYESRGQVVDAVSNVSLAINAGEFVALQGPSGCGKSTLLMMAGALLAPTKGRVTLEDSDPYELPSDQRAAFRADHVGFVFQQFHLVPYLSVIDNVRTASLASGKTQGNGRADALLERFGLTHRRHHTPDELSTGERQRTALARALMNEPRLLLADEPTGNLDSDNAAVVLDDIAAFKELGGAVLLVTHDPRAAERADRAIHMRDGRLA